MRIIDAMAYTRRVFEKDISGRAPRNILTTALHETDVCIWCWDPAGAKASRQRIYPQYKAKRLPPPENIWPMIALIREGLEHTNALQIQVPQFEADDVIATLVRKHYSRGPITIVSHDADLRQLLVYPNVQVEAPTTKFNIPPQFVRLFKTCVGDTSDNVSGVPGFGPKTWEEQETKGLARLQRILTDHMHGKDRDEDIKSLCLPKKVENWILNSRLELLNLWAVVGLWDVPQASIDQHTTIGKRNPMKVSEILAPYFL
jgi:hypothetical protein